MKNSIIIYNRKLNTISSVTAPLPQWPGDFKWSNAGVPKGYHCDRIWELKQPANQHWKDNFFCWRENKADPGIRFNMNGKLHRSIIMKIKSESEFQTYNLCVSHCLYLKYT